MKRLRLLPLALLLAVACSTAPGAPRPRDLMLGVDACEVCHMTVDDPGLAAQFVEPGGKVHRFDAPACLVTWVRKHPGVQGAAFVSDYERAGGWIPAGDAAFVRRDRRAASMGLGLVALRSAGAAAVLARETGGRATAWATLLRDGADDAHAH